MKNFLAIFFALFLFSNTQVQAEEDHTQVIVADVAGMVCDFCARGLEKTFGKQEAVDHIDISLNDGTVVVFLKASGTMTNEVATKLIEDNGISVENISRKPLE